MKKLIFLILVIFGFSCEKKEEFTEELDFINFYYFVNEDSVNIFQTEAFDTLDILFKSNSNSINWEDQRAINSFAIEKLNWSGFGFTNSTEENEQRFVFDYLDQNPHFMVFYSNQIDVLSKDKIYSFNLMSSNQEFFLENFVLDSELIFYKQQSPIAIHKIIIPNNLLRQ